MNQSTNLKNTAAIDLIILIFCGVFVFYIASHFDFLEKIIYFMSNHEELELDELITVALFLVLALAVFSMRRWREQSILRSRLTEQNSHLKAVLSEVKELKEILPICSMCKQIRDDQGYWHQLESFIASHTDASFSHGICPDCIKKHYPDYAEKTELAEQDPQHNSTSTKSEK